MHRFDSCGVPYPPVKDDFKIPIFIIVFNIWPFGVIFGYFGTLPDDSGNSVGSIPTVSTARRVARSLPS